MSGLTVSRLVRGHKMRVVKLLTMGTLGAPMSQGIEQNLDGMTQLRLLPVPRPLTERFGVDFFRAIPEEPGVYVMRDSEGRPLYVGQSGDLRARVNSYRFIHPDRDSRRLVRLVFEVRSITWETVESVAASLLRENELLRTLKPRWNVMNTRPEHYAFFGVRVEEGELQLRLTKQSEALPGETLHGAFKGIGRARLVMAALLRLVWSALHRPPTPFDIPLVLNRERPPEKWVFRREEGEAPGCRVHESSGLGAPSESGCSNSCDLPDLVACCGTQSRSPITVEHLAGLLDDYLSGRNPTLIDWLCEALLAGGISSSFHQSLFDADLEVLLAFYQSGPLRNARMRAKLPDPPAIIPKEQLDDLISANRSTGLAGQFLLGRGGVV